MEPHVVDARALRAGHFGPAHYLTDVGGEGAARILRLPVHDGLGAHGFGDLDGGGGRRRRGWGRGLGRVLSREAACAKQGQRDERSDARHDGSPTGVDGCSAVVRCTARRRRCSSTAPSAAAITVPTAPPPSWNRARYWRCRPAHLPENSAPTIAPQDPWIVVK